MCSGVFPKESKRGQRKDNTERSGYRQERKGKEKAKIMEKKLTKRGKEE